MRDEATLERTPTWGSRRD